MKNIDWLSPTQIKSLVNGGSMFFEILEEKYKTIIPDNASAISKLLFCEKIAKLYLSDIVEYGKIKNIELVRVGDITYQQRCKMHIEKYAYWQQDIKMFFNKICQEKNLNIIYKDNPYIILYEVEK